MVKLTMLCLPVILFLTACDNETTIQHNGKNMYVSTDKEEVKRYQLNPSPQKRYKLTINIENSPGDFKKLRTVAHYQVTDNKCKYIRAGIASSSGQSYFLFL